jgi:hypothetical protein
VEAAAHAPRLPWTMRYWLLKEYRRTTRRLLRRDLNPASATGADDPAPIRVIQSSSGSGSVNRSMARRRSAGPTWV